MTEPLAPPSGPPRGAPPPPPGLGARAARGAAVTLAAQAAKVVIQVVSVVVLARLLTPHDYGLLAMVVAVIGIGELFRDFGLSSAAIQAPTLSVSQRNNLFWINSAIGVALAVLVFFGAGLLAAAYRQPDLIPIARTLSLTFVINGLATQYRAGLVRGLQFKRIARAEIIAPVIALIVAITAALGGWSYWTLVAQQLSQATVMLVILVLSAGWLPGLPRRHVPIAGFIRFGWHMLAANLVSYISNNVDSVTIGVRFGAASLGLYSRAFQLLMVPLNQVRTPLTTVALPVLSRIQHEKRFDDYISRGQLGLGYTVVAGLGIVVSASQPIASIFLGPKWLSVAPILSLLAVAGIFQILAYVGYWVYVSRGLTGSLFRYTLLSAGIKIACILVGSTWGVIGVAAGYALAPALSWPISFWWLSRRTRIPTRLLYSGAARVLGCVTVSAFLSSAACFALAPVGPFVELPAAVLVTVLVYLSAAALIPPVRRDIMRVVEVGRLLVPARQRGGTDPRNHN